MNYPKDALFDLETLLDSYTPDHVLLIGDQHQQLTNDYQQQRQLINKPCSVTRVAGNVSVTDPALLQRYDIAIVTEAMETATREQAQQLLGRLRDLCAPRVAVLVDHSQCDWQNNDFFAFGLFKYKDYENNQQNRSSVSLYHYNIDSYKKTPDWFNSKNWANPELWNKFFW